MRFAVVSLSGLGCAKTLREFAVYRTELVFTSFGTGLMVFPDFRRHSLLQTRHIDGIGSDGLLWA